MSKRLIVSALFVLLPFAGCEAKKEVKVEIDRQVSPPLTLSKEALIRLEAADQFDGKSDHVIGKCYVCGLGMDGSDKFAVKVEGYTAHLCSKMCQHEFNESAEKIVLTTELPKSTKQE